MPEYTYKCTSCEATCEKIHSISERLSDCEQCNVSGSLERIPSLPFILKKNINDAKIEKPGKAVNDFISDAKQELIREKEELSKKEY